MPQRADDAEPVMWHTGRDYNALEGLHLWAEVNGTRVEIRKRVSRILGRPSNSYRVWEVFVNGVGQRGSHLTLQAAKEAAPRGEHPLTVSTLGTELC